MPDVGHPFSNETARALSARVGEVCSNRGCRAPTGGPSGAAAVGLVVAVHATFPGGPRYDEAQTDDERQSIHNGVWLCAPCSELVQRDESRFPAPLLRAWRADSELAAFERVGSSAASARAPTDGPRLSVHARELMVSLAELYANAGFPRPDRWSFTPGDSTERRYGELRAAGLVTIGTSGTPWR
jgi:hypothetical protein